MEKNMIRIENISKSFSDNIVLENVSFSIGANEQVAIIGPSGSGKSTLMNIMMKILSQDSGEVFILGKNINEYTDNKVYAKQIGMIQQNYNLIDSLSVLQNVQAGRLHEWHTLQSIINLIKPIEKEKAVKLLERVGIGDKINHKVFQLSGGETQRVAIARMMMQDPQIILADEPVSSLDPTRAREVINLLINLSQQENKTLLASIHSVNLVKDYFNRVIGIRHGKIVIDKRVKDVTENEFQALYEISGEAHVQKIR